METLSSQSPWFPFVSVDTEKLNGEPVFRKTRVPVRALFDYLKDGYDLAAFLDHFRGVTREQAEAVLELSQNREQQRSPILGPVNPPPLIRGHLPAVLELCRRQGVARLWVFGSAVAPADDPRAFEPARSDVDFLVEFGPHAVGQLADAYFGLREGLATIFGRSVDLVTVGSLANPYFRASVERTRVPLYAAA